MSGTWDRRRMIERPSSPLLFRGFVVQITFKPTFRGTRDEGVEKQFEVYCPSVLDVGLPLRITTRRICAFGKPLSSTVPKVWGSTTLSTTVRWICVFLRRFKPTVRRNSCSYYLYTH